MAEIVSEMAANVWKILVRPGDSVSEGDPVAILESMKMEIPVVAPASGTVSRVLVQEGAVVQEGDVIAVLS